MNPKKLNFTFFQRKSTHLGFQKRTLLFFGKKRSLLSVIGHSCPTFYPMWAVWKTMKKRTLPSQFVSLPNFFPSFYCEQPKLVWFSRCSSPKCESHMKNPVEKIKVKTLFLIFLCYSFSSINFKNVPHFVVGICWWLLFKFLLLHSNITRNSQRAYNSHVLTCDIFLQWISTIQL